MDAPTVNVTTGGVDSKTDNNDQQDKENLCGTQFDDALAAKIRQQCEFYFSDANILKDQFMLKQVKASVDGWVKLKIIEAFKKMQKLTQEHAVVVHALSTSDQLEVSADGASIRRRNPLPGWDSSVYHRSVIITDLPEDAVLDHGSVTAFLTTEVAAPLLVRLFVPGRKVSMDLKRSQVLHPQLGTKLCAIVEFADRALASKAISVLHKKWPSAYVHLLSYGSKKGESNPKKITKKKPQFERRNDASDASPTTRPLFLMNLRNLDDVTKVVHLREPLAPPSDDAVGFPPSWRELLRLERLALLPSINVTRSEGEVLTAPFLPPDDAIVSAVPLLPLQTI